MDKRFLLIPLMIILVSGLVFGGCAAPPAPSPPPTPAPVKILTFGVLGPETGFAAAWHMPEARNSVLWAEKVNAAGGIDIAGEKYEVKVIREDDKMDPTLTRAAVEKLIYRDKIDILYGPLGLACTLAALPTLTVNKIVNICSTSGHAIGPQWPYCFRWIVGFESRIPGALGFAHECYPDIKTIAIFNPRHENGLADQRISALLAAEYGWEVVYNEVYEYGTTDFKPYLAKMMAQKPDLIHLGQVVGGEMALQLKQLYEMGYRGYKTSGETHCAADIVPICGAEAAEGLIVTGVVLTEPPHASPGTMAYKEEYINRWGEWDAEAAKSHVVNYFLQAALENATSLNPDAVVTALENLTWESPIVGQVVCTGEKPFGIKHFIIQEMAVTSMRDGEDYLESLTPVDALIAEIDKMTPEMLGIK